MKKIKIIEYTVITMIGVCLYLPASAQTNSQNYIKTTTYTNYANNNASDSLITVQYFDGLGRPVETVQKGITPAKADLIAFQEYDAFGRESNSWLPRVKANNNGAFTAFNDFKNLPKDIYLNDTAAYSKPVYEPSPLNRVLEQYGPGADWHKNGKAVKTDYYTNSSTYPCAYYYMSGDNLVRNNNYPDNQLYVTKATDEEGNISYEFKDKLGRVILQRQMNGSVKCDTYYIYDDFGNLRYVLPPLAANATGNGTYNENSTVIKDYAYVYKYNERNLCKWKQLPGCDPVFYVYDKASRLIFTQDGEQRKTGLWLFSIPDDFGRIVLTGTCKNTLNHNNLLADVVKATHPNNSYPTNTFKGYTISGITPSNPVVLLVNYYDDYSFRSTNGIPNTSFDTSAGSDFNKQYTGGYKGLLTGTLTAVISGNTAPTTYLYSIMFYDYRGQLIQSVSSNHLSGTVKEYFAYDFTGNLLRKKQIATPYGQLLVFGGSSYPANEINED